MGRVGGRGWVGGPFNSAPDNMKPLGAIRRGWEWGTAQCPLGGEGGGTRGVRRFAEGVRKREGGAG